LPRRISSATSQQPRSFGARDNGGAVAMFHSSADRSAIPIH
jgi:hypothetical protein